ncbi:MAG: ABC transporter ATP-binding protein [Gallionella sp.]
MSLPMRSDIAISVKNLTKTYRIFGHPGDRIKQALTFGKMRFHREFTALQDISFEIRKGETVGIIGRNGSGKSTLLQLICGILKPTSGHIQVNGRISALLELGSGFNLEFTGRENVYFQGAVMGISKDEMDRRFDDITAFADIGQFIDQPVRTYSSGMYVRLAFSVQALSEPDILIIDEALSVGDFFFQQKCLSYIRTLCEKGVTLLFVSHDTSTVNDICSRAIYLKNGQLKFSGETRLAMQQYFAEKNIGANPASFSTDESATAAPQEVEAIVRDGIWAASASLSGNDAGHLIALALYDVDGHPTTSFRLGSTMHIKVAYRPAITRPTHVSVEIRNKLNQVVTLSGSSRLGLIPPEPQQGQPIIFEMRIELQLEAGNYAIVVNLGHLIAPNQGENLDSSGPIGPITIHWDYEKDPAPFFGMCGLPADGVFKAPTAGNKP